MRNFRLKQFFNTAFALCSACFFALSFLCARACKLKETQGTRTFYLQSPSSCARQTEQLKLFEVFFVQGESVRFCVAEEEKMETLARDILKEYNAVLVCEEEACGVISYYAFSPNLYQGVQINGKKVNLHIAVKKGEVAVGSPIIFGGF